MERISGWYSLNAKTGSEIKEISGLKSNGLTHHTWRLTYVLVPIHVLLIRSIRTISFPLLTDSPIVPIVDLGTHGSQSGINVGSDT